MSKVERKVSLMLGDGAGIVEDRFEFRFEDRFENDKTASNKYFSVAHALM